MYTPIYFINHFCTWVRRLCLKSRDLILDIHTGCTENMCKGGFTRQSNAGDGYLQPANDGGKGGFTRRAKAGDNNQQTADNVKTAIPRLFTRTM